MRGAEKAACWFNPETVTGAGATRVVVTRGPEDDGGNHGRLPPNRSKTAF